jgi:hypothetical protein
MDSVLKLKLKLIVIKIVCGAAMVSNLSSNMNHAVSS